ncbi:MAG: hypothetical protein ABIP80_02285 [Ferruginibacter sp.]
MDDFDKEQAARKKKALEKKWCRMVDLPGYKEWSARYQGLDRIISDLNNYHILVHPDELSRPLDSIFELEFKSWLEDFAERAGGKPRDLNDYAVA